MPLGAILRSFGIEYKASREAFFEIESDEVMNAALAAVGTHDSLRTL